MLEELHRLLSEGATVVTPTRRLARHIASGFERAQIDAGKQAWPSADVLPWSAWIERMLDEALGGPDGGQQVLGSTQERELWRGVIRAAYPEGDTVWLAGEAQEAWRLQREWRIRLAQAGPQSSADVRAYAGWARTFASRCRSRGWLTGADAVDALLGRTTVVDEVQDRAQGEGLADTHTPSGFRVAAPGGVLVLYAFDALTVQQRALADACAQAGLVVRQLVPSARAGNAYSWQHALPQDEYAAIATQARALLARDPDVRIGIVVADLAAQRAALTRALDDAFDPARVHTAPDERLPYALSLGLPLAQWAPVRALLLTLKFAFDELPLASIGELLLSPYLAHADSELHERASLDAVLRDRGGLNLSGEEFVVQTQNYRAATGRCQALAACLARWLAQVRGLRGRRLPSQWAQAFLNLSTALGWPGERALDSAEYQAVDKALEMIRGLAVFDVVTGRVEGREALGQVTRLLSDTLFQPESPQVPVQVIGVLESAGLAFDYLFVTGMTDQAWPASARPNALLPVMAQRRAGVPHAHLEWEHAFARRMMDLWSATATHVVYSFALRREDVALRPSALLAGLPAFRPDVASGDVSRLRQIYASRQVEYLEDRRAPALRAGETVRGGAGVLRDQSACPFRAFAVHRLSARRLEEGRVGLHARDRGTLVHTVMAAFARRVSSSQQLRALDERALQTHIDAAVEEGLARMAETRAHLMPLAFRQNEALRLSRLLHAFVRLERQRAPYRVQARESGGEIALGGLLFRARPDRIDEIDVLEVSSSASHPDHTQPAEVAGRGARIAIIDYKTGDVSIKDWFGARPREPQLPMYALAHASDLALVAFARLSVREVAWRGLARTGDLVEGVGTPDSMRGGEWVFDDWNALLAHWRGSIEALATGYLEGHAQVDPRDGRKTCTHCDLETLCRVQHASEDSDSESEFDSDGGKGEPAYPFKGSTEEGADGDA